MPVTEVSLLNFNVVPEKASANLEGAIIHEIEVSFPVLKDALPPELFLQENKTMGNKKNRLLIKYFIIEFIVLKSLIEQIPEFDSIPLQDKGM
jgi:hypothetical protein